MQVNDPAGRSKKRKPTSGAHRPCSVAFRECVALPINQCQNIGRCIMSVLGISFDPSVFQISNSPTNSQQRQDPLQLLGQALQSGNLTAAQQAYNALTQKAALNPGQTQNGQLTQDLSAVGQALKSGDLSGATQAYSKLKLDFQNVRHTHHRHHKHKAGESQNPISSSNGTSSVTNGSGSIFSSIFNASLRNLVT
jgi:hypothetical protein